MPLDATHPLQVDASQFPIRRNQIYLNHAGTSPIPLVAAQALGRYATEVSEYASSIYPEWTKKVERTRERAARLLNAQPQEIAFTKSTTAGLHLIGLGLKWRPGDVVVAEEKTFPANWLAWKAAEHRGARIWVWPERRMRYELEDLEARLKEGGVRLVATTSAQFATGFRQDVEAVGRLCRQYGALHCVDAIQTLGVFPMDVRRANVDFLAADSHKWLMGPEGSALLYVAKDKLDEVHEHMVGWLGREHPGDYDNLEQPPHPHARRFEEGSPNVGGIIAMGESLELLMQTGIDRIGPHNRALCRVLEEGLANLGWQVRSPREEACASSIVSAWRQGVNLGYLTAELWRRARIFGVVRRNALRLSPHFYLTEDDMRLVVETLRNIDQTSG